MDPYWASSLVAMYRGLVCFFVSPIMLSKFKRRSLQYCTVTAIICGNAIIAGYSYANEHDMIHPPYIWLRWLPLIGIIILYTGFSSGLGAILFNNQGELMPNDCRSTAGALIGILDNIILFIWAKNLPILYETLGMTGIFSIFVVAMSGFLVFIYFFVPETYGLTLEEIEAIFIDESEIENQLADMEEIENVKNDINEYA